MVLPVKTGHDLTVRQQSAVDLLALGHRDGEVGRAVGVSRQTVCGWRCHDAEFQLALDRRRREIYSSAGDRVRSLCHKALDVIEAQIDLGDVRAAKDLLRLAGTGQIGSLHGDDDAVDPLIEFLTSVEAASYDVQETGRPAASRPEQAS